MNCQEIMKTTMQKLLDRGADKVALTIDMTTTEEFNVVFKELNLLRSLESQSFSIMIIKDQKQATTSLNQFDDASIDKAVENILISVENANQDPAFDISPFQEPLVIEKGHQQGDLDKICYRLNELTGRMEQEFPEVLYDAILSYVKNRSLYLNSNQTMFEETIGSYNFSLMFSAKKGDKISSLNYTGFSTADLDKDLLSINFTDLMIKQITEQITTKPIPESFKGDILLMPLMTAQLLSTLLEANIGNNGLLMKTSRFPDHIEKKILDEKLTVHTRPLDPEFSTASHITADGFIAENATIIEKGVLKHYPISIYAANKTGKKRTIGPNKSYLIDRGEISYTDLIKRIQKGILCVRLSYGSPNANGDFSGVLKNSYYIEDGKLMYPVSETMMAANLVNMFNNIAAISEDEVNFGSMKAPFMLIKDVYFSK